MQRKVNPLEGKKIGEREGIRARDRGGGVGLRIGELFGSGIVQRYQGPCFGEVKLHEAARFQPGQLDPRGADGKGRTARQRGGHGPFVPEHQARGMVSGPVGQFEQFAAHRKKFGH